jgi:hypothetical protein
MSASFPIPKGLYPPAQGCEPRATLGHASHHFPLPQRGCIRCGGFNPVGVVMVLPGSPRVARGSQPWAKRRCPVGANKTSTLATLRDPLLPKLLSGENPAISKMETARSERAGEVSREVEFYNRDAIITVGYPFNPKGGCLSPHKPCGNLPDRIMDILSDMWIEQVNVTR